jgi:hypothetical protein
MPFQRRARITVTTDGFEERLLYYFDERLLYYQVNQILRIWWDHDPQPAVECPVGDFFACGWRERPSDLFELRSLSREV